MGEKEKRPFLNSRQIRKQNDRKYLLMVVFTLVVLGAGLILLPWLVLVGLEKLVECRERK